MWNSGARLPAPALCRLRPRQDLGVQLQAPRVLLRQWVLVTPVLQVVYRMIPRHLPVQTGFKADEADSDAVRLIQRFGLRPT